MNYFFQMPRQRMDRPQMDVRPLGLAGRGTSSMRMPSSGPSHQYSADPSRWHSNQPATCSSYSSSTGKWFDSSAAVPRRQPSKPNKSSLTSQSSETFAKTSRFSSNASTMSGFQQQNLLSSQVAPQQNLLPNQMATQQNLMANQAAPQQNFMANQMATQQNFMANQAASQQNSMANQAVPQQNLMANQAVPQQNFMANQAAPQQNFMASQTAPAVSKSGDGMLPSQSALAGGNMYGWSNATSADQWQTQPQWSWVQGDNQWPSSQPLQYMVCYSYIYHVLSTGSWHTWLSLTGVIEAYSKAYRSAEHSA